VLGCFPLQQDTIGAWSDPGENDFRLACESQFHLLRNVGRGADMVGKGSLDVMFETKVDCVEGKESEEEAKKWQQ
jgi:hypothetical protein